MSSAPINPGKIVWLAGPSSSGKTTTTRGLADKGWMRIEADAERSAVEVQFLRKELLSKLSYLESHLTTLTTDNIIAAICGGLKPSKTPSNLAEYEKVRQELYNFLMTRTKEIHEVLLIHMLDKAIGAAIIGKNVILDHVPMINDPGFTFAEVTLDKTSTNLWIYKDFRIEQQLKYVPIEILMRNVIRRNHNPDEHREMSMVLEQYSQRFVALSNEKQEHLGTLKVETLKKWIERAIKIDFFDISPKHGFKFDEARDKDIDSLIEKRMKEFIVEMSDPDHAIDPTGEKADDADVKVLKEKVTEYPNLQKKIDEMTKMIMENMKIPKDATEVQLTYASASGVKPTVIKDIP